MAENMKPKSKLDLAFEEFERETADCKVIRKEMVAQLREDVKKMRPTEYDKAMTIQAKMSVVNTLRDMLKDVEDSSLKVVKMHMSRQEQENNGQYSQAIIQLLKMVRADGSDANHDHPAQKEEDIQNSIVKRSEDLKIEITEGELEECSPLPSISGSDTKKKDEPKPKAEEKKD